ncbi:MAG TPA: c-type cytochrome [Burkholderiaceae bacterium]|nr:c-type cytochrome [Burkholderiaceae bacterium]
MNRRQPGLALCAALLASALWAGAAGAQQPAKKSSRAAARAASAPASAAAPKVDYAQRFATVCAACHGANGRGEMPEAPVLAGQPSFYVVTQLFLFREGRRNNEAMTAVAKSFTDADLRGYSDFIGTLPPVPPPPPAQPPDPSRMAKGRALAQQNKCFFCHGDDLSGGQQVPRIAGQREDYLRRALHGFRSGSRPAYTQAMIGATATIAAEDLDTLAYFAAHFQDTPAGK